MAFRIFISLIIICCAYFAFETVRLLLLQRSMLNSSADYSLGNHDGDLAFVQFLDYSCSFCRASHPIISKAVAQDGNVHFIPRPVSTLESEGINAALLPYAAARQGAFAAMHGALMENYRVIDEQVLQDLALEVGIDPARFKADVESKAVQALAQKNLDIFQKYRLGATPAYAVGKNILFIPNRDLNVEDFTTLFQQARGQ